MGLVSSTAAGPVALPRRTPTAAEVRKAGYRPVPPGPDMYDPRLIVDSYGRPARTARMVAGGYILVDRPVRRTRRRIYRVRRTGRGTGASGCAS